MRLIQAISLRATLLAAGLGCAILFAPTTQAAAPTSQYQQDVQRCNTTPGIDKKACLKEAGAAAQAAHRDALSSPSPQAGEMNRSQRCSTLPADQRQDCMTLMGDNNATQQGSVESGGILRETTITIPAPADSAGS